MWSRLFPSSSCPPPCFPLFSVKVRFTRKSRASEVDPGGNGAGERDGLAAVEGDDHHGGGEQVPDPIQQSGSGRDIEALGRFVEQEDVGPSEESLCHAEAPALATGQGQS